MEVDIVIEEVVGSHKVLVGVECTAGKRKATIEWYREMRAKHADLPIAKTVLVSESGFTREVYKKAKKDDITLLTFGEAQHFKWQALFGKLKGGTVADVGFPLREASLTLRSSSDESARLRVDPDVVAHGPGIEHPLGQLIMAVALEGGLTRAIMANLGAVLKKTDHFSFSFRVPEGTFIEIDSRQIEFTEVHAVLSIHPRFQSVDWRPLDFNGQTVAAGAFPADFLFPGSAGDSVVTASEDGNNSMKVTLLGPSDTDVELDVFPHALWPGVSGHGAGG
ncbi:MULTISPECIES: hypothetical protein [unclassified Variovorax]|uniref:hypothetical protein n=1 Tax=unclassified Variovorax TaxID=663243 RepID=UPI003F472833